MEEPKIGIVIVNYNAEKYQNDAIRSIKAMDYSNYEIIIVDNNSTDNSIAILKSEFKDIIVVKMKDNLGVAAGNNAGIKLAIKRNAEYILLINNDVEVSPSLLKILVENASERIMTIPKIYYYDKRNIINTIGGCVDWDTGDVFYYGTNAPDCDRFSYKRYVGIAATCCMLIHKNVFKSVGLMDPKYFMYYDDTDFCVRAEKKGYKILYVPEAKMWHKVSMASGGPNSKVCLYYSARNYLYFSHKFKKYTSKKRTKYIIKKIKYAIAESIGNKNSKYILLGYLDYFLGRMYRKAFK